MEHYIYWFVLALVMIIMEMATGTFYLLMLGIAMAAGGCAALLNAGLVSQLVISALVIIAGTIMLRRLKGGKDSRSTTSNLDEGQTVKVLSWQEHGTARVFYRGAEWDAKLEENDIPHEATLYIKEMQGSILILTQNKPQ